MPIKSCHVKACNVIILVLVTLIAQYAITINEPYTSSCGIEPPLADIEYVIHFNPGSGGWILVKFYVHEVKVAVFSIGKYMMDVVEITGSNVPCSFDRSSGNLYLEVSGMAWAWFNYTFPRLVWYYSSGDGGYLPKRVLIVDIGKDYAQLCPKMAFFLPSNWIPVSVILKLDGDAADWFVIATYTNRVGNMLFFDKYELFVHSPFLAGKLYRLASSTIDSVTAYVPLFMSEPLMNDTINLMLQDGTYDIYSGIQYRADVIARGVYFMAKLLGLPPLRYVYMYPLRNTLPEGVKPDPNYITDMRLYEGLGVFHNDMIWRVGHILHHYAAMWLMPYSIEFENLTVRVWFKGMQDYLPYVVASIVTGNPIYNGSLIVPRYLLYLRSFEERETAVGIYWGGPVYIKYVYSPLAMFYLDNILRDKSRGALNIYKLYGLVVANKKWQTVYVKDVEALLEKEFGINMAEYFDEVRNFNLNRTLLRKFVERGRWYDYFYSYLDFIRENFTLAPDTLYMIYLEYIAWKGDPEFALYPFNQWLFQDIVCKLFKNLSNKTSITRDDLINFINNLTDGKSNDFFEFYSKYAHLNLSVGEVEAFINGTYERVLGKLIAAKKMINAMSKAIDVSDLNEKLQVAYSSLKRGEYSRSEKLVDKLISEVYEVKTRDSDHDKVPDWVEIAYGSDPYSADTDKDGVSDLYELFAGRIVIDGDISDWIANSVFIINVTRNRPKDRSPISGNSIRSIYLARDDKYLYIALTFFDKPFTVQNRLGLTIDKDLNLSTNDDRERLILAIPQIIGLETLNMGFFGDFVEIKLPLKTLHILGVNNEFTLVAWIDICGEVWLPYGVRSLPWIYCLDFLSVNVNLISLKKMQPELVKILPSQILSENEKLKARLNETTTQLKILSSKYSKLQEESEKLKLLLYTTVPLSLGVGLAIGYFIGKRKVKEKEGKRASSTKSE